MIKFIIAVTVLVTGLIGVYWFTIQNPAQASTATTSVAPVIERKALYWRNPMNPAITSPIFAKDEMGMDYLPVYADENGTSSEPAGTVSIDPVTVQNIGVRSAKAERRSISRQLSALGRIDFNEERLTRLHPKSTGWIEKLQVNETGAYVRKGDVLLELYSPDLVAAQREYLVALENWDQVKGSALLQITRQAKVMLQSSRERLELLDVPAHQVEELESSRKVQKLVHIHSPFSGSVMNIGARDGQYISPKDELYLIADLGRIWVNVDVYEDDLPWIKIGDQAEMTVRADPGNTYKGKVSFIQPTLQQKSRTIRVRLEFPNPKLTLKPGMFANVILHADTRQAAVVVPSEAIVRSGSQEQVFVVRAPGKFEPRKVTLGLSAGGSTQILAGIESGEQVVTSSQFLIDSESKLREATAKMVAGMLLGEADAMLLDMSDMSMDELDMKDEPQRDGSR